MCQARKKFSGLGVVRRSTEKEWVYRKTDPQHLRSQVEERRGEREIVSVCLAELFWMIEERRLPRSLYLERNVCGEAGRRGHHDPAHSHTREEQHG